MSDYRIGERKADNKILVLPVAAGEEIKERCMIAINSEGYAAVATKKTGLVIAGMSMQHVDNRNGENGARNVNVYRGSVVMARDETISETDILKKCYVSGGQEVTITAEGSSVAGVILEVKEEGLVTVDLSVQ